MREPFLREIVIQIVDLIQLELDGATDLHCLYFAGHVGWSIGHAASRRSRGTLKGKPSRKPQCHRSGSQVLKTIQENTTKIIRVSFPFFFFFVKLEFARNCCNELLCWSVLFSYCTHSRERTSKVTPLVRRAIIHQFPHPADVSYGLGFPILQPLLPESHWDRSRRIPVHTCCWIKKKGEEKKASNTETRIKRVEQEKGREERSQTNKVNEETVLFIVPNTA